MYRHLLLLALLLTLNTVSTKAQARFSREIEQIAFVPKGQWITGLSVSYSQANQDKYQFLIFENLTGDSYRFKVSPMAFYTFADNLAGGMRMSYSRQQNKLDKGSIKIDSETSYDLDNIYTISQTYSGTAAFRNYISFGQSTRFGMFNEVQLQMGGGQSKFTNGKGESLTGTYQRHFTLDIGLSPGLIMFLNNYSALEVNVGVLGFSYTHTKSITDQIYIAHQRTQFANFKINLFSITFGVAFYL